MSTNWFDHDHNENSFPAFPYATEGLPPSSPYVSHDASGTPPPPHTRFTSRRNVLFLILGAVGIIVLLCGTLFILGGNTTTPKSVVAAVADATATNGNGTSTANATQDTTSNGPATYAPTSTYPPTSTTIPGHAAPTPYPTYTPYPTNVPYPTYTPPPGATATNTAIPIQTLTDDLNDWSHTYAHDADLALNTGGASALWGDTSAAYRQSIAHDAITWNRVNILQANFTCYFFPSEQPIVNQDFAVSSDGTHWSSISPTVTSQAGQNSDWTKYVYSLNGLSNVNFVKMTWLSMYSNGSPQCGQTVITYQS